MSCRFNALGQPACMIVPHPDHENERFCATCRRRFRDKYAFGFRDFLICLLIAVVLAITVSSPVPLREETNAPESELAVDEKDK